MNKTLRMLLALLSLLLVVVGCQKTIHEARSPAAAPGATARL